jgi:hypothetical protein
VRELPIFRHTDYLQFDAKPEKPDPEPLGGPGSAPAPDPKLYATYDGKQGEPSGPALGTETRPGRKDQGRPHLIGWRKPAMTGTATGLPDGACRKE